MKNIFFAFLLLICLSLNAQIPPGYYNTALGLSGQALKVALHNIIKNHTVITYDEIRNKFQYSDKKPDGTVWDIYSDIPSGIPPYSYNFVEYCGDYSQEGDCYNKEHSFPASWFNDQSPMYSDMFHIYPTDGWVNNKRGNMPYGDVGSVSWTSLNGSKIGSCNNSGYSGEVFEPIDEYKGDIARSYFYMAVRYYTESSGWAGSAMVTGAEPKTWAINMLLAWNSADTVSDKEIARNNTIYGIQHNRNPFIDHPELAYSIWGPNAGVLEENLNNIFKITPNPAIDNINVSLNIYQNKHSKIEIFSIEGKCLQTILLDENPTSSFNINLANYNNGIYLIRLLSDNLSLTKKIIIKK